MRKFVLVVSMACLLTGGYVEAAAEQIGMPQTGTRRNQSPDEAQREREQARARNKERQEKLKADTDQLLKLATELKQYVDKTNENILSVEVVKKTEEIEKLAKKVKEGMRDPTDAPGIR